jgi:hypothetical protein
MKYRFTRACVCCTPLVQKYSLESSHNSLIIYSTVTRIILMCTQIILMLIAYDDDMINHSNVNRADAAQKETTMFTRIGIDKIGFSVVVRFATRGYMIAFQWRHIIGALFHGLNFRTWKISK